MHPGGNLVLQIILTAAVISDFRSEKIPNLLILIGIGCGIAYRIVVCSALWYEIVVGIVAPIILFFFLFLISALGAGDIKLFSVIGCFWPVSDLMLCIVLSFVTGAVLSIGKLLIHKQLFESLSCFYHYFQTFFQTHKLQRYPGRDIKVRQLHFSLAIYIGFLLTIGGTYGKIFDSFM